MSRAKTERRQPHPPALRSYISRVLTAPPMISGRSCYSDLMSTHLKKDAFLHHDFLVDPSMSPLLL